MVSIRKGHAGSVLLRALVCPMLVVRSYRGSSEGGLVKFDVGSEGSLSAIPGTTDSPLKSFDKHQFPGGKVTWIGSLQASTTVAPESFSTTVEVNVAPASFIEVNADLVGSQNGEVEVENRESTEPPDFQDSQIEGDSQNKVGTEPLPEHSEATSPATWSIGQNHHNQSQWADSAASQNGEVEVENRVSAEPPDSLEGQAEAESQNDLGTEPSPEQADSISRAPWNHQSLADFSIDRSAKDNAFKMHKITMDNFKEKVEDSSDAWIVEFYSSHCGTCQEFEPIFEGFAKNLKEKVHVQIGKVDISEEPGRRLATTLNALEFGVPAIRIFTKNDCLGEQCPPNMSDNVGEVIQTGMEWYEVTQSGIPFGVAVSSLEQKALKHLHTSSGRAEA